MLYVVPRSPTFTMLSFNSLVSQLSLAFGEAVCGIRHGLPKGLMTNGRITFPFVRLLCVCSHYRLMYSVEFVRNCESKAQDSAETRLRRGAGLVCTQCITNHRGSKQAPKPQVGGFATLYMTNQEMHKRMPRHAGNS